MDNLINSLDRINKEVECKDRGRQLVLKLQIKFFDRYTGEIIPIYPKYPINYLIIVVRSKAVSGPFKEGRKEWFKNAREEVLVKTCNDTIPKFQKILSYSLGGDKVDFDIKIIEENKKYSGIFVPLYIRIHLANLEDLSKKYRNKLQDTIAKLRLWYGLIK